MNWIVHHLKDPDGAPTDNFRDIQAVEVTEDLTTGEGQEVEVVLMVIVAVVSA